MEPGVSGAACWGSGCHGRKSRIDNQSKAVAIKAHGNLDRLCWRGSFSSVDRSESFEPEWVGARVGLGLRSGWPSLGELLAAPQARCWAAVACLGPGLGGSLVGLGLRLVSQTRQTGLASFRNKGEHRHSQNREGAGEGDKRIFSWKRDLSALGPHWGRGEFAESLARRQGPHQRP